MRTNLPPRRRADVAEAETSPASLEVVSLPLLAHGFLPGGVKGRPSVAPDAKHAPAARAARQPAASANRSRAAATPSPRSTAAFRAPSSPAGLPVTAPRHKAKSGVIERLRKFVDGSGETGLPSSSRGQNKARGDRVAPKPRASGNQGDCNLRDPSHWAKTPGVSRPSSSARNRHALQRAAETLEQSMPPRNNSPTLRNSPDHLPRTPAPYVRGLQNQGLSDSVGQQSQGVTGVSLTEQLSSLRRDALLIAQAVDTIELLVTKLAESSGVSL